MTDPARYPILLSLGNGGMGEVFLADDTQLERKVAVKFLPDDLQDDPSRPLRPEAALEGACRQRAQLASFRSSSSHSRNWRGVTSRTPL